MGKQIAKYKEIEHDILTQIQNGKLQIGDQILTENELCSRYQVSRMTARKALDLLSSKGILTRTPGKGTFVNSIQITKTSNETRSYSNDMRSIGKVPGSILVSYQVRRGADVPEAAEALNRTGRTGTLYRTNPHRGRHQDGFELHLFALQPVPLL